MPRPRPKPSKGRRAGRLPSHFAVDVEGQKGRAGVGGDGEHGEDSAAVQVLVASSENRKATKRRELREEVQERRHGNNVPVDRQVLNGRRAPPPGPEVERRAEAAEQLHGLAVASHGNPLPKHAGRRLFTPAADESGPVVESVRCRSPRSSTSRAECRAVARERGATSDAGVLRRLPLLLSLAPWLLGALRGRLVRSGRVYGQPALAGGEGVRDFAVTVVWAGPVGGGGEQGDEELESFTGGVPGAIVVGLDDGTDQGDSVATYPRLRQLGFVNRSTARYVEDHGRSSLVMHGAVEGLPQCWPRLTNSTCRIAPPRKKKDLRDLHREATHASTSPSPRPAPYRASELHLQNRAHGGLTTRPSRLLSRLPWVGALLREFLESLKILLVDPYEVEGQPVAVDLSFFDAVVARAVARLKDVILITEYPRQGFYRRIIESLGAPLVHLYAHNLSSAPDDSEIVMQINDLPNLPTVRLRNSTCLMAKLAEIRPPVRRVTIYDSYWTDQSPDRRYPRLPLHRDPRRPSHRDLYVPRRARKPYFLDVFKLRLHKRYHGAIQKRCDVGRARAAHARPRVQSKGPSPRLDLDRRSRGLHLPEHPATRAVELAFIEDLKAGCPNLREVTLSNSADEVEPYLLAKARS
ncbi:hypothetical protein BDK51DRAFT_50162 [Blyttiomyces helicus]|uniref:Uncharacterized protein n=1 Tax=Blyttiomyces helicus TaxID=388810 RepID=A0A4P9W8J2_9FUNG|nr:hypothetical protein BDK51DRAFT_50162 [Blyttiomyces helicus]|eukprot:RKO88851.1 hypothetical protein BDK51DRAFT_50162 [Blyttiomyces helicus]